jgi:NitT/TauT family transport system substrate-binding protein
VRAGRLAATSAVVHCGDVAYSKEGRMPRNSLAAALLCAGLFAAGAPATAQDRVTFGTDWRAQAEHGCFYQAQAAGIYRAHGLEVTIRQGGPNVNHRQLMINGALDFNMGSNAYGALNFAKEGIPMVAVAAIFQKLPAVLIAHPGVGNDSMAALKGRPILISTDARATWWLFLKQKFGFTDDQIRPYTFNPAPFLADRNSVQQGYLSSEPYSIEKQAGFKPVVMLIADSGFAAYSTLIETSEKLVREKPDLVQRFVDASIKGCYAYHYGDPAAANALIKRDNPEMTDDLLAHGRTILNQYGILDSGDAKELGIGAMTEARWKEFFDSTVAAGVYPAGLDWRKGFTTRFVNKRTGM